MKRHRHRAFIGLGGNIGDPIGAMADALQEMDRDSGSSVVKVSSVYRTPPWGRLDQPDFHNAVAELETDRTPRGLLELGLDIEHRMKRVRRERWGPRPIDIDVLWYDGRNIAEEGLNIPHPRMLERAFVMVPLAEIAGGLRLDSQDAAARAVQLAPDGVSIAVAGRDWWRRNPTETE